MEIHIEIASEIKTKKLYEIINQVKVHLSQWGFKIKVKEESIDLNQTENSSHTLPVSTDESMTCR